MTGIAGAAEESMSPRGSPLAASLASSLPLGSPRASAALSSRIVLRFPSFDEFDCLFVPLLVYRLCGRPKTPVFWIDVRRSLGGLVSNPFAIEKRVPWRSVGRRD